MGLFQTDWRKQVTNLTPPEKRSASFIDWLTSLVDPIQIVMDANEAWDEEVRRRARYNARKMVLQDALNTIFGQPANSIIVETQTSMAYNNYVYNEAEGIDLFSYNESEFGSRPIYTFNDTEAVDTYDFLVKVPVAIYTAELDRRIRAEVTQYKLSGKSFNVVTY